MKLLDRTTLRILDRLAIAMRPRATAARQGSHRSPVMAQGVEFADHRGYVPGDDVRHIDWKAFARHGELTLRQFQEERDAHVHVLLDVSGSMGRGDPPKLELARRVSAAFAYVGTRQFDRARVSLFAEETVGSPRAVRTARELPGLEALLDDAGAAGGTDFAATVRDLCARGLPRGLVVVVSDLMATTGWEQGFRQLGARGHDLRVVRVTCAEDDAPNLRGELELFDAETGERVRLRVSEEVVARYREEVAHHVGACRDACRRAGGRFVQVDVGGEAERTLVHALVGKEAA